MLISEYKTGIHWAYRRGRQLGTPAQKVKLLALVERDRSRWVKIRHVEGELAGFEEFVRPTALVCRWADWSKLRRDEEREIALAHAAARSSIDTVTQEAASTVLAASGEDLYVDEQRGYTRIFQPDALERVADRAGFDDRAWTRPPSFSDREGVPFVLNDVLVSLAVAFAAAEPETVTLYIDAEEEKYRSQGYMPGERYLHDLLLRYKPAWAVARRWAGKGAEHENLRREVGRLRALVEAAAATLEAAGRGSEAHRLRRGLAGR